MNVRAAESGATEFLRKALAEGARGVPKLEAMPRGAGLLGDRQRITHTGVFKRAKISLGIRSVRAGFGSSGGWLWELPRERDEVSAASTTTPQPDRTERRVPVEWVEGVARLDYCRPPSDVPRHRWRQFVDDCTSFMNSPWGERAAAMGWSATALFGCRCNHPLMHLGSAGLMWAINGGELVELHRTWAVIDRPLNRSKRIFYRRDVDAAGVILPWGPRAGK